MTYMDREPYYSKGPYYYKGGGNNELRSEGKVAYNVLKARSDIIPVVQVIRFHLDPIAARTSLSQFDLCVEK